MCSSTLYCTFLLILQGHTYSKGKTWVSLPEVFPPRDNQSLLLGRFDSVWIHFGGLSQVGWGGLKCETMKVSFTLDWGLR